MMHTTASNQSCSSPCLSTQKYLRGEFRNVMPILKSLSLHCRVCLRLPLLKVLTAMAKLFQLTLIEALFLVYLVRETGWAIRDPLIQRHSAAVRDVMLTHVSEESDYKNLVLYLALACFSLKESLNEDGHEFQFVAMRICPSFEEIYEDWSQKYAGYTNKICPEQINKLFTAHAALANTRTADYVSMVDDIIEISPAYSFTRCLKPRLTERLNEEGTLEQPVLKPHPQKKQGKMEIEFQTKFYATFSNTMLLELANIGTTTNDYDEQLNLFSKGGIFQNKERAHSDPQSEDEECIQENLPPLSEQNMLLMQPESFPDHLEIASVNGSQFGGFYLNNYDDDFF